MKVNLWLMFSLIIINVLVGVFFWSIFKWWFAISGITAVILFVIQNSGILDIKNVVLGITLCFTCGWFGLPYYAIYYFFGGNDE